MRNLLLTLAYDGSDFSGWQRQPDSPTIQALIEARLSRITGSPVKLTGSGRTDAGVHAAGQTANFRTECPIPCQNLIKALNDQLPPTVRVRKVRDVRFDLSARRDARAKLYRYRILLSPVCPPFLARYVWHYPYALNLTSMMQAVRAFEGEHDFTSFASADHQPQQALKPRSAVRRIMLSRLQHRPRLSLLVYDVCGNGFLNHMVRNIIGTLVEVGRGRIRPDEIGAILAARDRRRAGPTAPPQGLTLVRVTY